MQNSIGIIDLDSIIFAIMHPNKVLDKNGLPERKDGKFVYFDKTEDEIEFSADKLMNDILFHSRSTHYIAYVKGKNTINSRLSINPNYKQNRPIEQPKFWEFTKKYLINIWNAIEINDMEVDDACRITRKQIPGSFIIAIDGDLLKLEGRSFNWRKMQFEEEVVKKVADFHFWRDMLKGQPGDNVKGIPGIGLVGANKILDDSTCPPARVLKYYINYYGEKNGISEFYKNYNSLYILEDYDGFEAPAPIRWIIPDHLKEAMNNRAQAAIELPE